jgi:pimeloyl-ACP methyl ester carboxylesterase
MYPRDKRSVFSKLLSESTALWEIGTTLTARRTLARLAPKGDGHPVMLVPGFTASSRAMGQLRRFLDDCGYQSLDWGLGRNTGVSQDTIDDLTSRVNDIATASGQKVSIIGWSGGGMYARAVATAAPKTVRQVITMGTPFKLNEETLEYLPEGIHRLHERLSEQQATEETMLNDAWAESPPVPSTSIFSKRDALAPWPFCLDQRDEQSENIQISASHAGMPFNSLIYYLIAERLAQKTWQPFRTNDMAKRLIYRHACASEFS